MPSLSVRSSLVAIGQLSGLLALLSCAGCTPVVDGYCAARLPRSQITVQAMELHYTVEHRLDAEDLRRQDRNAPDTNLLGLTSATSSVNAQAHLHTISVPGVGLYVRPDIEVNLQYWPVTVQLALELKPDSCTYDEVLRHEMRHVNALRNRLAQSQGEALALLRQHFEPSRLYRFSSVEAAQQYFQAELDGPLSDELRARLDAVALDNAAIDTPEEYQRLSHACNAKG